MYKIHDCVSDSCIVTSIPTPHGVLGVTSVDNELFVLLNQNDNQVVIYSINDYELLRHLSVPGLKRNNDNYMTSCVQHKCLYFSHKARRYIQRFALMGGATSKWSVPGSPYGLSVTRSCNVLVTCRGPNKLVELNADSGQCIRELRLDKDIWHPFHGVQVTTDQFVVSHGAWLSGFRRVCLVDGEGKVTRSYGDQHLVDIGPLGNACHFAVHICGRWLQSQSRVVESDVRVCT